MSHMESTFTNGFVSLYIVEATYCSDKEQIFTTCIFSELFLNYYQSDNFS